MNFQGCGVLRFDSAQPPNRHTAASQGGTEGFDGKLYFSYGQCGSEIGISDKIQIAKNNSQVEITRENCMDLAAPKRVQLADLNFSLADQTTLGYGNKIFDEQGFGLGQKVTLAMCSSNASGVESQVWSLINSPGVLYGRVDLVSGPGSGPVQVTTPDPSHFVNLAGQPNVFDLRIDGSLIYSIGGGPPQTVPQMTCSTQSAPSTRGWQLNEANTGLAGAGVDRNSLPVYTGPSTPAAGTVIRLVKVTTPLYLHNGNITLDRVWVQPTTSNGLGSLIFTYDPSSGGASPSSPVTILDSDIDGSSITDPRVYVDCAVLGSANIYRNNIFGMGNGICIHNAPASSNVTVERNYVHDLRGGMVGGSPSGSVAAGIRSFNGSSLTFRDNRLVAKNGWETGAFFIQARMGFINNVLIEGNLLETSNYGLILEANNSGYGTNMRTRDNRFVRGGYGPAYVIGGPGWTDWINNYLFDVAQPEAKGSAIATP